MFALMHEPPRPIPSALLLTILGATLTAVPSCPASAQTLPLPAHIVIVMEENHSYSQIIKSPLAPYINSLAAEGASFTDSHAITHPSQPNYLALFSGSTQGVNSDACPQSFSVANLASEMIAANLTFTGYAEGLPSVGSEACNSGEYAPQTCSVDRFHQYPVECKPAFH